MLAFNEIGVKISPFFVNLVVGTEIAFEFFERFHADIGRVADDGIKTSALHDHWEAILSAPIEDIDSMLFAFFK